MPRQEGWFPHALQEIVGININLQPHAGRQMDGFYPLIYNCLYINVFFCLYQGACTMLPAQERQRGQIRPKNAHTVKLRAA